MSQYIIPILAAIPGLIAAIVAYLSKEAGKERKQIASDEHAGQEQLLREIRDSVQKRESAEVRKLKKQVAELERQLAEARQTRVDI